MVVRLCVKVHAKPLAMILLMNRVKKVCFSDTFLLSSIELRTGTRVRVNIRAPNKANPRVHARGENIFPSTFSEEKMGINAEMMISLEKKIAFPIWVPV